MTNRIATITKSPGGYCAHCSHFAEFYCHTTRTNDKQAWGRSMCRMHAERFAKKHGIKVPKE